MINIRDYNFEVKVGLFVFLAVILLIVVLFSIGDFSLFKSGYTLTVYFNYVEGIEIGAPVRLAGVKIGEIKSVDVLHKRESGETSVGLKTWVDGSAVIKSDSLVHINTLGLLGEKYLEITPGREGEVLKEHGVLRGQDPIPFSEFTSVGYDVFMELKKTVESVNDVFADKEVSMSLKETAINSRKLSENLVELIGTSKDILSKINKGEGTIGKLFFDESLYNKIDYMVDDIRRHPWMLLYKPSKAEIKEWKKGNKGNINTK